MIFDTHAYHGQPGALLPQFAAQGLFGGPLAAQLIAGCLGPQQLAAPFGTVMGQLGAPTLLPTTFVPYGGIGGWIGQPQLAGFAGPGLWSALAAQYGHPVGQPIGPWSGQPQVSGFAPQGLFGALAGQYGSPVSLFGGFAGLPQLGAPIRGFTPYQTMTPQMTYTG